MNKHEAYEFKEISFKSKYIQMYEFFKSEKVHEFVNLHPGCFEILSVIHEILADRTEEFIYRGAIYIDQIIEKYLIHVLEQCEIHIEENGPVVFESICSTCSKPFTQTLTTADELFFYKTEDLPSIYKLKYALKYYPNFESLPQCIEESKGFVECTQGELFAILSLSFLGLSNVEEKNGFNLTYEGGNVYFAFQASAIAENRSTGRGIIAEESKLEISEKNKAAAHARHAPNYKTKAYAIELYESQVFKNAKQASEQIVEDVFEYGASNGKFFTTKYQAQQTIYRWLLDHDKSFCAQK